MGQNLDIFSPFHLCQQLAGDLLSRNILVEEDPVSGMSTLSRIEQLLLFPLKLHAVFDQFIDDRRLLIAVDDSGGFMYPAHIIAKAVAIAVVLCTQIRLRKIAFFRCAY